MNEKENIEKSFGRCKKDILKIRDGFVEFRKNVDMAFIITTITLLVVGIMAYI